MGVSAREGPLNWNLITSGLKRTLFASKPTSLRERERITVYKRTSHPFKTLKKTTLPPYRFGADSSQMNRLFLGSWNLIPGVKSTTECNLWALCCFMAFMLDWRELVCLYEIIMFLPLLLGLLSFLAFDFTSVRVEVLRVGSGLARTLMPSSLGLSLE